MRFISQALLSVAVLLGTSACGNSTVDNGSGGGGPPAVATVNVSGVAGSLIVGHTVQLTATALDASGAAVSGSTVSWTSSSSTVATVSSSGVVTGVAPGTATISATSAGVSGTASITVIPVPAVAVASVAVTAPKTAFTSGETSQFAAVVRDAQGNTLAGRATSWATSQATVATVSSSGVVTAVGAGTAVITAASEGITSPGITVTVTVSASLLEQRILAQQGLAIALASTVLQTQFNVLTILIGGDDVDPGCVAMPGGGSVKVPAHPDTTPSVIPFYFDAACTRPYLAETVTTFTVDTSNNTNAFHIIATGAYTGPTGTSLGTIHFDETANAITFTNGGTITGTVNGLGTWTSTSTPTVHLGLDCDLGAGGHNIGICQGGIQQDFAALGKALGSVTTLNLDSTAAGVLPFAGTSTLTSGALGSLVLAQPTHTSMTVTGGTAYGSTSDGGSAANFSLFPPTPTGWTVTDTTNDQVFNISVIDNATRTLAGTIKRISTGATLATMTLDQSGTGTMHYSDGSTTTVTAWLLSQ